MKEDKECNHYFPNPEFPAYCDNCFKFIYDMWCPSCELEIEAGLGDYCKECEVELEQT